VSADPLALRAQGTVDGRRTDGQHGSADLGREIKVTVALQRRQEGRNQRLQPLATDPVRGLPQHDQCLVHGFVVEPSLRARR
jgi:hypothetical protein